MSNSKNKGEYIGSAKIDLYVGGDHDYYIEMVSNTDVGDILDKLLPCMYKEMNIK